jgi:hypothetical protein
MKRTSFKRPVYERKTLPAPSRVHGGVQAMIADTVLAQPKENVLVSETYKNAVRSLECMRCGWPPRSQFAHTDEGKGGHIKTDDRRGWAGCGPRPGNMGCHYLVGTSGTFTKLVRRAEDERLAAKTRATLIAHGKWPKNVPMWEQKPLPAHDTRAQAATKGIAP